MSIIVSEVYEAFIDAGATEEKAKAAASVIPVGEQLATRNDIAEVKADIAEVKAEVAEFKAEVKADIAEVKAEVAEFKAEVKAEMGTRLARLEASLDARFAAARAETANEFKTLYRHLWLMAASIVTVIVLLDKLLS